jgi:hypothetical protein
LVAQRHLEVVGVGGDAQGVLGLDHAVAVEGDEVPVEGLHAVEAALGHDRGLVAGAVGVGDRLRRPPGVDHDLEDGHPAAVAGPADQPLADDAAQGGGQRQPDLALVNMLVTAGSSPPRGARRPQAPC